MQCLSEAPRLQVPSRQRRRHLRRRIARPADWAGVRAGVAAATSAYLFTHPPVNDFFATLRGQTRDEMRPQVQAYLDANPQVRADLDGIKQPAVDFIDRCSYANPLTQ